MGIWGQESDRAYRVSFGAGGNVLLLTVVTVEHVCEYVKTIDLYTLNG